MRKMNFFSFSSQNKEKFSKNKNERKKETILC